MKHPSAQSFLIALKKTIPAVLLLGTLSFGLASTAHAQITITFSEVGSDVEAVYGGSVPSFSMSSSNSTTFGFLSPVWFASLGGDFVVDATLVLPETGWVTGSASGGVTTGDSFGFDKSSVIAPVGYSGGASLLAGSVRWSDTSFDVMGLVDGSSGSFQFVGGGADDTVSWSVGAAVPEPGSFAAIAGLASLGFVASRRRRRVSAGI